MAPVEPAASGTRLISALGRAVLVAALGVTAWQLVVLVQQARSGASDIGFLLRAAGRAAALGGGVYGSLDPETQWPCSVPPSALASFAGLRLLGPTGAGLAWAAVNVALLAGTLAGVSATARRLTGGGEELLLSRPWWATLLLALSWGSLQTGQLSVVFVACWSGALWAFTREREAEAGAALALPAALKLYPGFLVIVPVLLRSRRQVGSFLTAVTVLLLIPPCLAFGPGKAADLWLGYARHGLLGEGDHNVVQWRLREEVLSNQALDVTLLRYLVADSEWRGGTPRVPHLQLPRRTVLVLAGCIRVVVFATSLALAVVWLRRRQPDRADGAWVQLAFWVATMVLLLPEAKARYAVYAFPALLPMIRSAGVAWRDAASGRFIAAVGLTVLCASLIVGVPAPLRPFGVGLLGPLTLWLVHCAALVRDSRSRPARPANT